MGSPPRETEGPSTPVAKDATSAQDDTKTTSFDYTLSGPARKLKTTRVRNH